MSVRSSIFPLSFDLLKDTISLGLSSSFHGSAQVVPCDEGRITREDEPPMLGSGGMRAPDTFRHSIIDQLTHRKFGGVDCWLTPELPIKQDRGSLHMQ